MNKFVVLLMVSSFCIVDCLPLPELDESTIGFIVDDQLIKNIIGYIFDHHFDIMVYIKNEFIERAGNVTVVDFLKSVFDEIDHVRFNGTLPENDQEIISNRPSSSSMTLDAMYYDRDNLIEALDRIKHTKKEEIQDADVTIKTNEIIDNVKKVVKFNQNLENRAIEQKLMFVKTHKLLDNLTGLN